MINASKVRNRIIHKVITRRRDINVDIIVANTPSLIPETAGKYATYMKMYGEYMEKEEPYVLPMKTFMMIT